MSELIKRNEGGFVELKLSRAEYETDKTGRDEIYYNGKMYDIRSVRLGQDAVSLEVVNDTREDAVLKHLGGVNDNDSQHSSVLDQLMKLLELAYISPAIYSKFFPAGSLTLHFCCYQENLISLPATIVCPPPRIG